jgi:uncharacterized membrane protein
MKTVVFCIDRDNDVGEKAGVKGPIIGRKDNLAAAMRLALADPEDTDLNTIFMAVKIHDQMKRDGRDVEVVTLLGDRDVGLTSDEKISHQIDAVQQVLKAEAAVIVTDGAEDEFVLPLIQSRMKIISINRVIVKSLPTGKETVSILRRYMQEERFKIQLLLPLSLVVLSYAIFGVFRVTEFWPIALAFVVGGYLAMNALNVEEGVRNLMRNVRVGVATSRLTLAGNAVAAIIVAIGAIVSAQFILSGSSPLGIVLKRGQAPADVPGMLIAFALLFAPVIYTALLVRLTFRVLDFRLRRGKHAGGLTLRFLPLTGYALLGWGAAGVFSVILGMAYGFGLWASFAIGALGLVIVFAGALVDRRFKDRVSAEAEEAGA